MKTTNNTANALIINLKGQIASQHGITLHIGIEKKSDTPTNPQYRIWNDSFSMIYGSRNPASIIERLSLVLSTGRI